MHVSSRDGAPKTHEAVQLTWKTREVWDGCSQVQTQLSVQPQLQYTSSKTPHLGEGGLGRVQTRCRHRYQCSPRSRYTSSKDPHLGERGLGGVQPGAASWHIDNMLRAPNTPELMVDKPPGSQALFSSPGSGVEGQNPPVQDASSPGRTRSGRDPARCRQLARRHCWGPPDPHALELPPAQLPNISTSDGIK